MPDLRVSFPRPCQEDWDGMAPAGCGRLCGQCETIVHDLASYDFNEVRLLLERNPHVCVRARVNADGSVALKPEPSGNGRRMMVAAGIGAGLLTAAQPGLAAPQPPAGKIVGQVDSFGISTQITATDRAGRRYRARAKGDGRYTFKKLPAGTYDLHFKPDCGSPWTVRDVAVGDGPTIVPSSSGPDACIVVGMLKVESSSG
jgi:hypothetical protein